MRAINVHERELNATLEEAGTLIDRLASKDDLLWPRDRWPPMRFDKPLGIGAKGGHGPIRYVVGSYEPGRRIEFRFSRPRGFLGVHRFELDEITGDRVRLRHVIDMRVAGSAIVTWLFAVRPLHDALMEDALDRAAEFTGGKPQKQAWSWWVKTLRRMLSRTR